MNSNQLSHEARLKLWRERMVACRSSGLKVVEWCRENQICVKTYYRWEHELLNRSPAESLQIREPDRPSSLTPVFAPVPIQASQLPPGGTVIASIRIGQAELNIFSGADPEIVSALCEVLKSC